MDMSKHLFHNLENTPLAHEPRGGWSQESSGGVTRLASSGEEGQEQALDNFKFWNHFRRLKLS